VSNHQQLVDYSDFRQNTFVTDERVNFVKERVKEGQFINKSLFHLSQVIQQISDGKKGDITNYRNSPLTKILRSSLGGNSRTAIIICITPATSQLEQTLGTLKFGAKAMKVKNKVSSNLADFAQDSKVAQ
jgi:hypothetical protein